MGLTLSFSLHEYEMVMEWKISNKAGCVVLIPMHANLCKHSKSFCATNVLHLGHKTIMAAYNIPEILLFLYNSAVDNLWWDTLIYAESSSALKKDFHSNYFWHLRLDLDRYFCRIDVSIADRYNYKHWLYYSLSRKQNVGWIRWLICSC